MIHPPDRIMPRPQIANLAVLLLAAGSATHLNAQPFTPVASPAIAGHVSFSTGATWVDFDGDGDLDLYVTTGFAADIHNVLYRNDAGSFVRVTGVPLVLDNSDSACSAWADYDNDGNVDCFVSNLVSAGGMLFQGTGGGALALNTTAGIGGSGLKGTGCAWGDYDNDGDVDLIVAALFGQGGIVTGNRLFHNNGDGTFTEVTTGPQVTTTDSHHHPTWADYDSDGDLDLFFGTGAVGATKLDRMYQNQLVETGSAVFTAITTGIIATDPRDSQVLSWVDYDNDGDLDMYAVNYSSVPNQLYRNDGGSFTKITTAGAIVTDLGPSHGVVWGDFDNDGDQDAYVVRDLSGFDRYYRNNADGTFTRITTGAFVTSALSGYGATAGDYDQDGDLDLFVPTARSEAASVLYRNDLASGAHSLTFLLRGITSNRSAIGAKVRVLATIGGVPRWQLRVLAAGTSYGGHSALEAHFGLGDATLADTVLVEWPGGAVDQLTQVAADARVPVVQQTTLTVPPLGPNSILSLRVLPNPTRDASSVRFSVAREGEVTLELFDSNGSLLGSPRRELVRAGDHAWLLPETSRMPPGIYLVRLRTAGGTMTKRMVRLSR